MIELATYHARDRRVYNGALCSDMQREVDHTQALEKRMRRANPEASCTYFPGEGMYMVFLKYQELTGNFHEEKQLALIEAIEVLENEHSKRQTNTEIEDDR